MTYQPATIELTLPENLSGVELIDWLISQCSQERYGLVLYDNQTLFCPKARFYLIRLASKAGFVADTTKPIDEENNDEIAFMEALFRERNPQTPLHIGYFGTGFLLTTNVRTAFIERIKTYDRAFQPGPFFVYNHYETMPMEQLQQQLFTSGPLNKPIPEEEVEDCTPSFEECERRWPLYDYPGLYDLEKYNQWASEQVDQGAFWYVRDKYKFNANQARQLAARSGRKRLIMDLVN